MIILLKINLKAKNNSSSKRLKRLKLKKIKRIKRFSKNWLKKNYPYTWITSEQNFPK